MELQRLFGKVIATRRAAQAAGAPAPEDMLQAFIDAEYKDGACAAPRAHTPGRLCV